MTLGEDYDTGEDCELVGDQQLVEATKFSREVSSTRHRIDDAGLERRVLSPVT